MRGLRRWVVLASVLPEVAVAAVVPATALLAQASVPPKAAFEVATIKRSGPLDPGGTLRMQPGGLFQSVNVDTRGLILTAYRTPERPLFASQVIGGPAWLATDRYDITAKVTEELAARPQAELSGTLPRLVQSLLEERFKLKVHHETRNLSVYVMTRANRDHLGPRLHESRVDCAAEPSQCALHFLPGHLSGGSVDMKALTSLMSGPVERIVLDHTGLSGRYDFDLEWSPNQDAPDKPSIFAAAQEQLGLKLESARAPVDVVVIDHIERPTEN